jgi:hypothetical protein
MTDEKARQERLRQWAANEKTITPLSDEEIAEFGAHLGKYHAARVTLRLWETVKKLKRERDQARGEV